MAESYRPEFEIGYDAATAAGVIGGVVSGVVLYTYVEVPQIDQALSVSETVSNQSQQHQFSVMTSNTKEINLMYDGLLIGDFLVVGALGALTASVIYKFARKHRKPKIEPTKLMAEEIDYKTTDITDPV